MPLPDVLRPLLSRFAADAGGVLPLTALWAHGSLALGDYQAGRSDLDLIALTGTTPASEQEQGLRRVHEALHRQVPLAEKLHCSYVVGSDLGDARRSHLTWAHGELFERIVSPVTRRELCHGGLSLLGPDPATAVPPVTDEELADYISGDMRDYWYPKTAVPELWLQDIWVDLGLLTFARATVTLREGRSSPSERHWTSSRPLARLPACSRTSSGGAIRTRRPSPSAGGPSGQTRRGPTSARRSGSSWRWPERGPQPAAAPKMAGTRTAARLTIGRMASYEPVDLSAVCNAGVDVLGGAPGDVPLGRASLRGLPFLIGSQPASARRCFLLPGAPASVTVGRLAPRVIIAHRLLEPGAPAGHAVGQAVADYVFHLAGGETVTVPVRERFEIQVVPPEWGQLPFLAVSDTMDYSLPRFEGTLGAGRGAPGGARDRLARRLLPVVLGEPSSAASR